MLRCLHGEPEQSTVRFGEEPCPSTGLLTPPPWPTRTSPHSHSYCRLEPTSVSPYSEERESPYPSRQRAQIGRAVREQRCFFQSEMGVKSARSPPLGRRGGTAVTAHRGRLAAARPEGEAQHPPPPSPTPTPATRQHGTAPAALYWPRSRSGAPVSVPAVHAAALRGASCAIARGARLTRPLESWFTRGLHVPPLLSCWHTLHTLYIRDHGCEVNPRYLTSSAGGPGTTTPVHKVHTHPYPLGGPRTSSSPQPATASAGCAHTSLRSKARRCRAESRRGLRRSSARNERCAHRPRGGARSPG